MVAGLLREFRRRTPGCRLQQKEKDAKGNKETVASHGFVVSIELMKRG
jgi:hypothetical protein